MEQPFSSASPAELGLKGEVTIEEPDSAVRAIGRRSAEVRATVPDVEFSVDIDAGPLRAFAERHGVCTGAVVIGACAGALRDTPRANAAYRDGHFELHSRVNVAVMLDRSGVPVMATLLDADTKSPSQLDAELTRLRARTAAGELTPPEQAGATFTFTDLGPHGIDRGTPLIVPPQAAALSAGAIREIPVIRDGGVTAGYALALTLACDHRILFGAGAAEFLARITGRLQMLEGAQ